MKALLLNLCSLRTFPHLAAEILFFIHKGRKAGFDKYWSDVRQHAVNIPQSDAEDKRHLPSPCGYEQTMQYFCPEEKDTMTNIMHFYEREGATSHRFLQIVTLN